MAIKRKTLLVENTPAKAAAKAAVKKAAIKSAARDVSKGVEATAIEVSDPNDPRLKSYGDSLALFNSYIKKYNAIRNPLKGFVEPTYRKVDGNKIRGYDAPETNFGKNTFTKNTAQNESIAGVVTKYKSKLEDKDYINIQQLSKSNIKPIGAFNFSGKAKGFLSNVPTPFDEKSYTRTDFNSDEIQKDIKNDDYFGGSLFKIGKKVLGFKGSKSVIPYRYQYDSEGSYEDVDVYKKPTKPYRLAKPAEKKPVIASKVISKPKIKIKPKAAAPIEKVQNGVLKADTIQTKPRVKRPGERIVADNASGGGYPNIDNVYINNRLDSIQNQAGERLKYGTKFTREWQYRKKK